MKTAIVYDWIDKWGGVERLLLTLHEMFPDADWYTSYHDKERASWADKLHIKTSFIQHLPSFIRKNRVLSFLLYPYAFESFNLSSYDLVISVTSSFAKSVITKPDTKHICYLLTPPRYAWGMSDEYISGWKRVLFAPFVKSYREWDFIAAQRPDVLLTLSEHVKKRITHYYHRSAQVVYPPFDSKHWLKIKSQLLKDSVMQQKEAYYLVVSRLEPYKKIDLVISACNTSKRKLVIIGSGSLKNRLRSKANSNITFIEDVSDPELASYYHNAKALILPQDEDFGYVSLEAQMFGCPVISYQESGVSETIQQGKDHIYIEKQSENSLLEALERFEAVAYNVEKRNVINETHLQNFSKAHFINTFLSYIS